MDPQDRVELNIQLSLETLGCFSRLLDQFQRLMAYAGEEPARRESGESPSFDPVRFQALSQAEGLRGESSAFRGSADPIGAAAPLPPEVPEPPQRARERDPEAPDEPAAPQPSFSPVPEAPEARGELSPLPDAPAAQGDTTPIREAPAVQGEIASAEAPDAGETPPAPDREEAPPQEDTAPLGELPLPESIRLPDQEAALSAPSAGYYPQVQLPEAPGGSWEGVREELTYSGPAPLTAEAVSLAFQRDDRRYDNGFPLY